MSVTAVPLRPIRKGSIAKLWIGLAALGIVAAGVAIAGTTDVGYQATASGLRFKTVTAGTGPRPTASDIALVDYTGTLDDGTVFDSSRGQPTPLPVDRMIPGFTEALLLMNKGGTYRFVIPGHLAYGPNPPQGAPFGPNADLTFDVKLLDIAPQSAIGPAMGGGASPHGGR